MHVQAVTRIMPRKMRTTGTRMVMGVVVVMFMVITIEKMVMLVGCDDSDGDGFGTDDDNGGSESRTACDESRMAVCVVMVML